MKSGVLVSRTPFFFLENIPFQENESGFMCKKNIIVRFLFGERKKKANFALQLRN
ncbi:MAG: hypothetical protein MJZ01_04185 [Bacteroidales bacterium]|nr:hypothetical protein [Bacteroidales bacterium]